MRFEDPVAKYDSRDGFKFNLRLLRTVFDVAFDVHGINVTGPEEITAR